MLDPEFEIDATDRDRLVITINSEGWGVLQKIMEAECSKFNLALLNVRPGNSAEILERHSLAKAAAQFVAAIAVRLNAEREIYLHGQRDVNQILPDMTEDALNMGYHVGEEE